MWWNEWVICLLSLPGTSFVMIFIVTLSFPVSAASTSLQPSTTSKINKRRQKFEYTKIRKCINIRQNKIKAPGLNLPLQMEGVSTSRQAMEDRGGLLGGQVWSPMEWWGQERTRGVQGRKVKTQLYADDSWLQGLRTVPPLLSSLAVCLPQWGECLCVCVCKCVCVQSMSGRRREHSGCSC